MRIFLLYMPINFGPQRRPHLEATLRKDVLTFLSIKTLPGKKVKESVQNYRAILGLKQGQIGRLMAQNFAVIIEEELLISKLP